MKEALTVFALAIIAYLIPFNNRSKVEKVKCDCGRTFKVYHNLYGTLHGGGTCQCGHRIIIN